MIEDGDYPDAPFRDYRLKGTPAPERKPKFDRAKMAGANRAREEAEKAKVGAKPFRSVHTSKSA